MSQATAGFRILTRRRLLALLAGSAASVAAGSCAGLLALRGWAPHVEGLTTLSNQECRTLVILARTHLPAGGAFGPGAELVDFGAAFDTFLAGEHPDNVVALKRALLLLEFGPVIFDGRASTFSHLDDDDRLTHWESWLYSDRVVRRQVATAFRKFISLLFFDQPEVWPHIGYPGPSMDLP